MFGVTGGETSSNTVYEWTNVGRKIENIWSDYQSFFFQAYMCCVRKNTQLKY